MMNATVRRSNLEEVLERVFHTEPTTDATKDTVDEH